MMAIVELSDIAKSFGSTRALRGVNLTIEEGEIVGLIDPNGAGKTTTLHIIHGLLNLIMVK